MTKADRRMLRKFVRGLAGRSKPLHMADLLAIQPTLAELADTLEREWPERKPVGRPATREEVLRGLAFAVEVEKMMQGVGTCEACRRIANGKSALRPLINPMPKWTTLRQDYYKAKRLL